MDERDHALVDLGRALLETGYRFTTVTPRTHARVNARAGAERARDVRGALGWSRPFARDALPARVVQLLERAGALEARDGDGVASAVRFSTLGAQLFVHSAYPTEAADAVFFGPDSYRFAALLAREFAPDAGSLRVVDIGCGAGVGGLALAARTGARVVLADVNALALRYARVNAEINRVAGVEVVASDVLAGVAGPFDAAISNPPYLADEGARTYRDGGGAHGAELSVRIAREALARSRPGGRLVLYTATAWVEGRDTFREAVEPVVRAAGASFDYSEIDPDVFGEELDQPAYRDVERIAVVALRATRR